MSRIGRMPVTLPSGVEATVADSQVVVKGPKGALTLHVHPDMAVRLEGRVMQVSRPTDNRLHRALHGLTRSLLANMVTGVSEGFRKELELVGVGYRVQQSGENLVLQLGLSHTVEVKPMPGLTLAVGGTNKIVVQGADRQVVGEMAARIRVIRPPNRYTGKGIRYAGELVRLKPGKSAARKK